MIKWIVTFFVFGIHLLAFSQVEELEHFRKSLTMYVNYDHGKIDSIPISKHRNDQLKADMEKQFLSFVMHPKSHLIDSLKSKSKTDGKSTFWFDQWSYRIAKMKMDLMNKNTLNNTYYSIDFQGFYDYNLSQFVSFMVQPFTVENKDFTVYYYKLNGIGKYYIKDTKTNQIVFSNDAFTSEYPLSAIHVLDSDHLLLLESMGENGQRIFVVEHHHQPWKKIEAFEGKQLAQNFTDFKTRTYTKTRTYLWIASTHTIHTHYGYGFFKKYALQYDASTKTISYVSDISSTQTKKATWVENRFRIDDCFLGDFLINETPPMPDY